MPRVVHFEIHAENPERAVKFYSDVFGWEITKWEGPLDYWLITTGPENELGINDGLMQRQGEIGGQGEIDGQAVIAYVCTVDVPSVDEYVEKLTQAGGSVAVPKMAFPGVGWLAYCKDTEGNLFGLVASDPDAK
jgi:predicted enzyme related to lactoylglutathione lyase